MPRWQRCFGALGIGALVSGLLATQFGLTWTIVLGGAMALLGTAPLFSTALLTLKTPPQKGKTS